MQNNTDMNIFFSFLRHWHRWPREVDAPFLEALKARLDWALSNVVWWEMSLPVSRSLEPDNFEVPSNTNLYI